MSALKFKLLEASAYPNCFSDVTHHSFLVFVRSMLQADKLSLLCLASLQHRHLQRSLLLQDEELLVPGVSPTNAVCALLPPRAAVVAQPWQCVFGITRIQT